MQTRTLDTVSSGSDWAPALFKGTAALTFGCGAIVHLGRMIVGSEAWVRNVFRPPVDIAFGVLMAIAAVPGAIAWRRYSGDRFGRAVYAFAMLMLLASIPLHLRTLVTWSTEYLTIFPFWYSAIELPMFVGLSYMMTKLKFRVA